MELTQFDIGVLVIMPLAIISMAFVFPALGLTAADPGENEIPEFEMDSDRFDFAGDAPRAPSAPTQGTLDFNASKDPALSQNQIWLDGDTQDGTEIVLTGLDSGTLTVNNWTAGTADDTQFNLTHEGQQFVYDDAGYTIAFTVVEFSPETDYYEVDYIIRDEPEDQGWIQRVPVVGGALSAAGALPQVVAWIGATVWYSAVFFVELAVNMLGMLFDVMSFLFSLNAWLVSTYADIISGASGFVTVFILVPGILLSLILAKVVLIGVSLLPTT